MKEKLKVGLMVESLQVPRWVRHMMERVVGSHYATLKLVIVLDREGVKTQEDSGWQRAIERFYVALERRLVRLQQDALEEVGLGELLDSVRILSVHAANRQGTNHLPVDAIAAIRDENLDVLFMAGPGKLGDGVLNAPRFGVWRCRHGAAREGAPAFQEVLERNPVTGSRLEVVVEGSDEGPVLYQSYASTHHWSVTKTCNAIYWKAASFFPRVLEQLWLRGPEAIGGFLAPAAVPPPSIRDAHSNVAVMGLVLRILIRRIQFTWHRWFWREQWLLLHATTGEVIPELSRFKEMLPPPDRDWADPHLLAWEGKRYLFLEEAPFQSGKGHISVMVLDEQGQWSSPAVVLEKPYHLSNPFVFEWNGGIYMVPESAANRTVDLYRCERFPDRWVHARTMLDGLRAVDATLFSLGAKCWMFVNMAENPETSTCDELFLFSTDDPVSGEWTPHPKNPIVSDVRCSRPAGALFVKDGVVIRPAQDCAERYGRAVRFMRIDLLNETDYSETAVEQLYPEPGGPYLGVHTYDRSGPLAVIDAIRRHSTFG